jgi:hypothetical protein
MLNIIDIVYKLDGESFWNMVIRMAEDEVGGKDRGLT